MTTAGHADAHGCPHRIATKVLPALLLLVALVLLLLPTGALAQTVAPGAVEGYGPPDAGVGPPASGAGTTEGAAKGENAGTEGERAGADLREGIPRSERHIPLIWQILLVLGLVLWIGVLSFISRDASEIYMNQRAWNTLVFTVGALSLILTLFLHALFVILLIALPPVILAVYVPRRNMRVPTEQRIFTPEHISFMARQALARIGIRVTEQVGAVGQPTQTRVVLMRKDGQTIDAVSASVRGSQAQSEATMAVKQIVESAIRSRATDIHIEPSADEVNIRFRIDGILHALSPYPPHVGPPMISVIKVLSEMDITEKRKPQDGTFSAELEGRGLDLRVATSATVHGETMAIRILDRSHDLISLDQLGMESKARAQYQESINAPHGMIIVCGPTGAGKTTSLYASMMEMDVYQKNIMTIEDPIEYRLDNISQTAIHTKAGITFASMLRSLLRQDPNVIMVGEIRDAETARVALQAAMTGHLVLTTLHANDTVVSLFRLLDLGVEPYLIASSLTCILAQRLVRKLCQYCRVAYQPTEDFAKKLGIRLQEGQYLYKARGCQMCQGTGYFGRVGIFELLTITDRVRDMIRENPSIQAIKAEARRGGMRTLQEDGLIKVLQGITTVKELIRVTK